MRAILSVSDKNGLADLSRKLVERGFQLISTGGTAKVIAAAGLPVVNVSEVTGFPEMMDGRVKTLHPKIHGGILARRSRPDDLEAIAAQGITPIDLVVVNLYPFAKAAADPSTPFDRLVEEIDIGGPSLVRAAAKNFRDVLVVVDPADYPRVLEELGRDAGPSLEFRFGLMTKAMAHTAEYDALIAMTLQTIDVRGGAFVRGEAKSEKRQLRYGENPHQKAVWIKGHSGHSVPWTIHQGKELSFTNLLDLDAAVRIALEFDEPVAVVIKHTNPCGVATGASVAEAYVTARDVDPLSAFGGIVGVNRRIDADTARAITSTFIEAVIAPALDEEAKAILAAKQNMRVVTTDFTSLGVGGAHDSEMRTFLGGALSQERDRVTEAQQPWPYFRLKAEATGHVDAEATGHVDAEATGHVDHVASGFSRKESDTDLGELFPRVVTKRQPTPEEWTALRFAWRVCAHVKSNTIIFTGTDRTLAVGAGQMSRVDAAKVAVMKAAAGSLKGSVAASDAFFPFRDGLDAIADAGATAVVQPGGSVRDAEVIAAADERGVAMVFTGRRHFRH